MYLLAWYHDSWLYKNIYSPLRDFIMKLFNVEPPVAKSIIIAGFIVVCFILLLIVALIVVKCVRKHSASKQLANIPNNNEEEKPVEEVKEEVKPTEEKPVEEAKEEVKPAEEKPVEEVKPAEEKPVEEVKEEVKPVEKKKVEEVKPTPTEPKVKPTPAKPTSKPVEVKHEEESKTTRIALGKYEVFPVNDVFLYRLKASNGEIMVISEVYKSKGGAIAAINTVKKNIDSGDLQISCDKHGLWQFKLFASNKRLLVVSANYSTQQGCESAAESFKKFAFISPITVLDEDPEHLMEEIELEALADKKGGKINVNAIDDEFEFKLVASNGAVLCSSNTYKTKSATTNNIDTLKEAIKTGRFFVVKDKNDMYQFKLYNTSGRCVIVGEAYKNKSQAISAANSVSAFINLAEVVDRTTEEVNQ